MLSVGRFWLMEKYDVDTVAGLVALARANEMNFRVADSPRLVPIEF